MGVWDSIVNGGKWAGGKFIGAHEQLAQGVGLLPSEADKRAEEFSEVDPHGYLQQGVNSARYDAAQDRLNFRSGGQDQRGLIRSMQARINSGQTVSGEIMRQGMQQTLANQQSHAAGAAPQNSAMAARNAAMNIGRANTAMAGQQAIAGMQERIASEQALGQLMQQRRQADLQSMTNNNQLGFQNAQAIENARTQRAVPQGGNDQSSRLTGAITAGAAVLSDKRLKHNIEDASDDAKAFIAALKPYKYDYKDKKFGKGKQLGIMAQDLEKTKLGKKAVMNIGGKKIVHGAKLAGALAAAVAMQEERLGKLEGK